MGVAPDASVPAEGDLARRVGRLLNEYADLLEIEGSLAQKASAYRRAALGLRDFDGDLRALAAAGGLRQIRGLGPVLERKVAEYLATGAIEALDRLREKVPPGVASLLSVRGVGPKLAAACWHGLQITDRAGLEAAAADGRLATLPGVGAGRAARLLQALQASAPTALLLPEAAALCHRLAAVLGPEGGGPASSASVAGEVRRGCPTVARLDVVAVGEGGLADRVAAALAGVGLDWSEPPRVAAAGALPWREVSGVLGGGEDYPALPLRVTVCAPGAAGTALLLATGSEAHLCEIAAWRRDRGESDRPWPVCADEESAYAGAGLPWIAPELREGRGEVAAAGAGRLPPADELITPRDIRGELHCHSRYSDGRVGVAAMAAAARARGYGYLCTADHSGSLVVAHGMTVERLRAQRAEIDRLNAAATDGFVILQGAEVEVLRDGSLDFPDDVLAGLDFCVASMHNAYGQNGAALTQRLLRALAHPAVDVIGHPTGRRLLRREAQPVDVQRIAEEAGRLGKALEINGSPERLDLDGEVAAGARTAGLRWFAVDSDAHSAEGLGDAAWGVVTARRAGLKAADVVNTLPAEQLRAWKRQRRGA